MDYTYLDYFNYYMKEYINELINSFPETQEPLLLNYRMLLEGRDDKNDLYVKCFYTKINNYLTQIAERNPLLFETTGKIFIEGIDLYNIWHNSIATDKTRTAIWKYLQILMILGRKIIPNHSEIINLLQKVSKGDINIPAKVEHTLLTDEPDNSDSSSNVFGIGNLASTINDVCKLASNLGGGNASTNNSDGGIMGDVCNILKNADVSNVLKTTFDTISNPEFLNSISQLIPNGADEEQTNNTKEQQSTDNPALKKISDNIAELMNNPSMQNFETEINKVRDSLNLPDAPNNLTPNSLADLFGRIATKDNIANMAQLVNKFGGLLNNDMINNINPEELINALGGNNANGQNMSQNIGSIIKNVMKNPQLQQRAKALSTRERLRNKLDKKNEDKQPK